MVALSWGSAAIAGTCLPPAPPWMPTDADDVRAYADLVRRDAETCFADIEQYFRCLDQERREVFDQAREVTESYAPFLKILTRAPLNFGGITLLLG